MLVVLGSNGVIKSTHNRIISVARRRVKPTKPTNQPIHHTHQPTERSLSYITILNCWAPRLVG